MHLQNQICYSGKVIGQWLHPKVHMAFLWHIQCIYLLIWALTCTALLMTYWKGDNKKQFTSDWITGYILLSSAGLKIIIILIYCLCVNNTMSCFFWSYWTDKHQPLRFQLHSHNVIIYWCLSTQTCFFSICNWYSC